ncbi:MAG: 1-acyl-sn-glycerol-3-phosphate acyltransferase [Duncaniella sp.]|nr:1-acyl-sn-glycerol-3-phosphate acyltransferase [Duncaniella sp.]
MKRVDVSAVLREKAPSLSRRIPKWLVRRIERFICQDRLNELLAHNEHMSGVDFAEGVVNELEVDYSDVRGEWPESSRVIFASNHPLGGLDGLVLSAIVGRHYGRKDIRFVVNDILTFVDPLKDIFIGVNKHGSQSKASAEQLDCAFASDAPVLMFPAGLCSRRQPDGSIADLTWNKMVINKAIFYHRDIIPVYFDGENSRFFYNFARLRVRLGLKFNIEMLRLPREFVDSQGKKVSVTFGEPISWQSLKGGREALSEAARLRQAVYSLRNT